jgi:two-component system sensor histidine kinase AlgZ
MPIRHARSEVLLPPVWLPLAASIPVGLCMVVLTLPSIGDEVAEWRRVLCLALYLLLCLPLLFLQRALWRRRAPWWLLVTALLIASYVLSVGSNTTDLLVARSMGWIPYQTVELARLVKGIDAFWLALVAFCALHAVVCYYVELGHEKTRVAEAKALMHEAELRALRYQLQPHFLFNTLNAISSLVVSGHLERTQQVISRLADFLRATLDDRISHEVTLADEIALTETYLAIEKARLGDRLIVHWNIGADILDKRVPHLLLQPLVENAIRHGIALRSEPGTLEIGILQEKKMLRVFVGNDGQVGSMGAPHNEPSLAGGMRNISERLIRLYGEAHNLQAEPRTNGGFNVSIGIPLRDSTTPEAYRDFHR